MQKMFLFAADALNNQAQTFNTVRIKSYPLCSGCNHPKLEVLTGPCPSLVSELHPSHLFSVWAAQGCDRHSRSGSSWDNARGFVQSQRMLHLPWELPPSEMKGSPKRCSSTPHICGKTREKMATAWAPLSTATSPHLGGTSSNAVG